MVGRLALVALVSLGACSPGDAYNGPAHVMLDWRGELETAEATTLTYTRHGRDFAIGTRWTDARLGEVRVDLFRDGDKVGREVVVGGEACPIQSGGLVLDGVQRPNPVVFTGACRAGDKVLAFRFAFTANRGP